MLNRPGSTKGNAYRNPLLSILTEFGEIKDGKNPDWASVCLLYTSGVKTGKVLVCGDLFAKVEFEDGSQGYVSLSEIVNPQEMINCGYNF